MWFGWTGNVIRLNLSEPLVTVESLDRKAAENFIGARGLGVRYLYEEIDPAVGALDSRNKLLFVTGPLTGTGAPGSSRYMVVTKGPLTGAIAHSSAGGAFASAIKYAGYDMLILEGKSRRPVYLWIDDDTVEVRNAEHLWGKTSTETELAVIAETHPDAKVCCIGPAGENQVLIACVMSDMGRAAGRSGVGAVMGSKNLKAIAVRGTRGVKMADKTAFWAAMMDAYRKIDTPGTEHFHQIGTPGVLSLVKEFGVLPTRNFKYGTNQSWEKLSGDRLATTISTRKKMGLACPSCPVGCGRVTKITNPKYASQGVGPEYETIGLYGSSCFSNDLEVVSKAGFICNELGMDTISAGATIACAMELYEEGHLPLKDVGMPLNFGNNEAVIQLTEDMAYRRGFGNILADGAFRLAARYGHPEFFMGAKKLEFASYDPRGLQGQGLGYATNSRGACHIRGEVQDLSLYGVDYWRLTKDRGLGPVDPLRWDDKPELAKDIQDWFCVLDSSGMCNFMFFLGMDEDNCRALIETATGIDMGDYRGLMRTGERIFNQERLFNLKAGLTGKDDTLPRRMLEEPMPDGPAKGMVVHLSEMLPEYYRLRGWSSDGIPSDFKLRELGLK
ncbi:MAG: aldehyde ferredoxin oxidoreductase family protein [Desulfobacterales bacterium]|nr:MAG: aldehyde ferredoxin oxidoreductase family protein [Desulfobacterales bacterium]